MPDDFALPRDVDGDRAGDLLSRHGLEQRKVFAGKPAVVAGAHQASDVPELRDCVVVARKVALPVADHDDLRVRHPRCVLVVDLRILDPDPGLPVFGSLAPRRHSLFRDPPTPRRRPCLSEARPVCRWRPLTRVSVWFFPATPRPSSFWRPSRLRTVPSWRMRTRSVPMARRHVHSTVPDRMLSKLTFSCPLSVK